MVNGLRTGVAVRNRKWSYISPAIGRTGKPYKKGRIRAWQAVNLLCISKTRVLSPPILHGYTLSLLSILLKKLVRQFICSKLNLGSVYEKMLIFFFVEKLEYQMLFFGLCKKKLEHGEMGGKSSLIKGRKKLRLFIMQLSLLSKFPYICDTVYLPYVFHPTALLIDPGPCYHLKTLFLFFCKKMLSGNGI